MQIDGKEILITGGTGSLGRTITRILLTKHKPRGIRLYSRDELKQWQFRNELDAEGLSSGVSFLIGDVRDKNRLDRAVRGVDIVFNTAAMKQVPACEYNPIEAVKTNIHGAENLIDCAIDNDVGLVMHVSTDKSVYPVNLYGGTKLVAERLFIHGNVYTGGHRTRFSCCRYGNVVGSRGSIIPLFKEQKKTGRITITDERMTRFWIMLPDVGDFIIKAVQDTHGGEIFVPVMPSVRITEMAQLIAPKAKLVFTGIRKGEKLHECLINDEESLSTLKEMDRMIIQPGKEHGQVRWTYSSDKNWFMSGERLKEFLKPSMEG